MIIRNNENNQERRYLLHVNNCKSDDADQPKLRLKGDYFISPENEAADDVTRAYVADLADRLGLSRGARPTSLRKILLCLSDYLVAVLRTRTGFICWRAQAQDLTGAVYGADIARTVRRALLSHGFITVVQPRRFHAADPSAVVYEVNLGAVPQDLRFKLHDIGSCVEVRAKKRKIYSSPKAKAPIVSRRRFSESQYAALEEDVKLVNSLMSRHPLTGPDGEQWGRVRRIFNDGRLDRGGRLYGRWQNKKAAERLGFRIDGEEVVEVDVKGAFLFLAYKMTGGGDVNLGQDPYQRIPFVRDGSPAMRKLAKELTSAMLSSSPGRKSFPQGRVKVNGKTITMREKYGLPKAAAATFYYNQIGEAFPFLKDLQDLSGALMFFESSVMLDAMRALALCEEPIVTYPIFDCLISKREDRYKVVNALQRSFLTLTGGIPVFDIEFADGTSDLIVPDPESIATVAASGSIDETGQFRLGRVA